VSPRGLRRGQVNFRSHNSCLSLGAPSPGRGRACVLFGVSFQGGYSQTGLPGDTVWLALPPTGWGGLSVLSQVPTRTIRVTVPVRGRSSPFKSNNWVVAASEGATSISWGSTASGTSETHNLVSTMTRRANARPATSQTRLATWQLDPVRMDTTFCPPTPFGRGASRASIPLGRECMRTEITSAPWIASTGCREEGQTPVVTCFPPRPQRRWWVRPRARTAVPPSQAALTPRRLSWSPRGEWQRLLAGPLAGYRGSPRASREETTDWLWPIGRVGVRSNRGTPRPNDAAWHTASRGTLPPEVRVGKAHPSVWGGRAGCRRPRESSRLEPWVGTHRTGGPEWGNPRPQCSGRGHPAVKKPTFPR